MEQGRLFKWLLFIPYDHSPTSYAPASQRARFTFLPTRAESCLQMLLYFFWRKIQNVKLCFFKIEIDKLVASFVWLKLRRNCRCQSLWHNLPNSNSDGWPLQTSLTRMILIYRGSITFILLLHYRTSVPRIKQEILIFLKKLWKPKSHFFSRRL